MDQRYLVIGCGKQGQAIAHDLCANAGAAAVTVADADGSRAERLAATLGCAGWRTLDAGAGPAALNALMATADVAISAVPYDHNLALTRAAISAGTHFCDLGGNNGVVERQFALDDDARRADVRIVPDCGIAPGAVSILARHAIDLLGRDPEYVRIRVGGIPAAPKGSFGYANAFSVRGLINEYIEPVEVLRDGRRTVIEPLGGHEELHFQGLGVLEAAYTSGGSSTLARTYENRVAELDYKTLRYPGHWAAVRAMHELGFFGSDPLPIGAPQVQVAPRELAEALLERNLPPGGDDLMVVRVSVGDAREEVCIEFVDKADPVTGHSAMQRTTGYSVAVIAKLLGDGILPDAGVLRQEVAVPAALFISEWRKRGIPVAIRRSSRTP